MVPKLLYQYCPGEVTDGEVTDADALLDGVGGVLDPEPCVRCGRGASPLTLDDEGAAWCLACLAARGDPDARFIRTAWRLAAAAAARQLTATVTAGATTVTGAETLAVPAGDPLHAPAHDATTRCWRTGR